MSAAFRCVPRGYYFSKLLSCFKKKFCLIVLIWIGILPGQVASLASWIANSWRWVADWEVYSPGVDIMLTYPASQYNLLLLHFLSVKPSKSYGFHTDSRFRKSGLFKAWILHLILSCFRKVTSSFPSFIICKIRISIMLNPQGWSEA